MSWDEPNPTRERPMWKLDKGDRRGTGEDMFLWGALLGTAGSSVVVADSSSAVLLFALVWLPCCKSPWVTLSLVLPATAGAQTYLFPLSFIASPRFGHLILPVRDIQFVGGVKCIEIDFRGGLTGVTSIVILLVLSACLSAGEVSNLICVSTSVPGGGADTDRTISGCIKNALAQALSCVNILFAQADPACLQLASLGRAVARGEPPLKTTLAVLEWKKDPHGACSLESAAFSGRCSGRDKFVG